MTPSELNKLKSWFKDQNHETQVLFLTNFHRKIRNFDFSIDENFDTWELFSVCCQEIQISETSNPLLKDLRGIPCPLNSAKARVYLHRLSPNTECEIWLDNGKPIENVPSAIVADGHKIIERIWRKNENFWTLKIQTFGN